MTTPSSPPSPPAPSALPPALPPPLTIVDPASLRLASSHVPDPEHYVTTLYTWGSGLKGCLGLSTTRPRHTATHNPWFSDSAVRLVSTSTWGYRNAALDAQGVVYEWGFLAEYDAKKTRKEALEGNLPRVKVGTERCAQVVAGGDFTVALTLDAGVLTWGSGVDGRLGQGLVVHGVETRARRVHGLDREVVVQIAAGEGHAACVTREGKVFTWGKFLVPLFTPMRVDTFLPGPARAVACGAQVLAVLLEDRGQVYTWGFSHHGELGHGVGPTERKVDTPTLVQGVAHHRIVRIACGPTAMAAVAENGLLFLWGEGPASRNAVPQFEPRAVAGLPAVSEVALGESHAVAVCEASELLYVFGDNKAGQLGMTHSENVIEPVFIPHLLRKSVLRASAGTEHSAVIVVEQATAVGVPSPADLQALLEVFTPPPAVSDSVRPAGARKLRRGSSAASSLAEGEANALDDDGAAAGPSSGVETAEDFEKVAGASSGAAGPSSSTNAANATTAGATVTATSSASTGLPTAAAAAAAPPPPPPTGTLAQARAAAEACEAMIRAELHGRSAKSLASGNAESGGGNDNDDDDDDDDDDEDDDLTAARYSVVAAARKLLRPPHAVFSTKEYNRLTARLVEVSDKPRVNIYGSVLLDSRQPKSPRPYGALPTINGKMVTTQGNSITAVVGGGSSSSSSSARAPPASARGGPPGAQAASKLPGVSSLPWNRKVKEVVGPTHPAFVEALQTKRAERDDYDVRIMCKVTKGIKTFRDMEPFMHEQVMKYMHYMQVGARVTIFEQGSRSAAWYILFEGAAEIRVRLSPMSPAQTTVARLAAGDNFGERGLIQGGLRAASIVTSAPSTLFRLDQDDYILIMKTAHQAEMDGKVALFQRTPILQTSTTLLLQQLSGIAITKRYAQGDTIFREGEKPDGLYILQAGRVSVTRVFEADVLHKPRNLRALPQPHELLYNKLFRRRVVREIKVAEIEPGMYFGELALIRDLPRTATVKALEPVVCVFLGREDFLHRVHKSMLRDMRERAERTYKTDADLVKIFRETQDEKQWATYKKSLVEDIVQSKAIRTRRKLGMAS